MAHVSKVSTKAHQYWGSIPTDERLHFAWHWSLLLHHLQWKNHCTDHVMLPALHLRSPTLTQPAYLSVNLPYFDVLASGMTKTIKIQQSKYKSMILLAFHNQRMLMVSTIQHCPKWLHERECGLTLVYKWASDFYLSKIMSRESISSHTRKTH